VRNSGSRHGSISRVELENLSMANDSVNYRDDTNILHPMLNGVGYIKYLPLVILNIE
jgi:hypothetical protein